MDKDVAALVNGARDSQPLTSSLSSLQQFPKALQGSPRVPQKHNFKTTILVKGTQGWSEDIWVLGKILPHS